MDDGVEAPSLGNNLKQNQISTFSMLEFTFACYYPGETPLFIPVDISLDVWVAKLEKMIYDELNLHGRKITRQDLRLYKVTIPFFWQTVD